MGRAWSKVKVFLSFIVELITMNSFHVTVLGGQYTNIAMVTLA